MARQDADASILNSDGERDKRHGPRRKAVSFNRPCKKDIVSIDVLHDRQLAMAQYMPRYAFTDLVAPAFDFVRLEAIRILDSATVSRTIVQKHDAPTVQPEELGHQMERFTKNDVRR
ncbi:hypothetical protein PanNE5_44510 [Pandoraea sp. NE5]|nr:hypothetical protein PanNE5_44510 [Pandoraea sp. NE5]